MRVLILFAFMLVLLPATKGRCQDGTVIKIRGIVCNAATNEPIPYATVRLTGKAITTMTNDKGRFLLKVPVSAKGDSLTVTHVGFTPGILPVQTADTGMLTMALNPSPGQLTAVEVRPPNPLALIRKAIEKIPENYPDSLFRLTGFYRTDGEKDKRIIDLSEAVFHIYNDGYQGKNNQFQLVRSREYKDLTAFNGSDKVGMGHNPNEIMGFDFERNLNKYELFRKDAAKEFNFKYKGLVDYNGKEAYLITFEVRPGVKKALCDGRLYLDADDLAFLELDQQVDPQGLKYYDEWNAFEHMVFTLFNISIRLLSDTTKITYRKYGSKYYLGECTKATDYYISGGDTHYLLNPLTVRTNYLVTAVDTANVRSIPAEEGLKVHNSIEGQGKIPGDIHDSMYLSNTDRFWANYNLIEAEFNVDSAIRVIQANDASLKSKKALELTLRKAAKDKAARLDTILDFYHTKGQFNGLALVQYEGKVIYEKGFGPADQSLNTPNTTTTPFRIGSGSEQFTALLIMQLVSEAKLSAEDSAGKFLPGFKDGSVTIGQLLCHQSGTRFDYTNADFVVLADIIEKVTGKTYAQVLAERIFIPLGMSSSIFASGGAAGAAGAGSSGGAGGITSSGGDLISSGGDLLRWVDALSGNTLLPKEMMDELVKPRLAWDEYNAWYAYGWMIDRHLFEASKRHLVQYHIGGESGFQHMLLREPDKNVVVILLSNTGDFPRFDMTDLILKELN
jgi:CubicO group peptidase (beta-lactamase class C family)